MQKQLIILLFLLFAGMCQAQEFNDFLKQWNGQLQARVNRYNPDRYNTLEAFRRIPLSKEVEQLSFENSEWEIAHRVEPLEKKGRYKLTIRFKCNGGQVGNASLSVDLVFNDWNKENYVLLPAAVYNGNRYPAVQMNYMPFFIDTTQIGLNKPFLLSDQPRLNYVDGFSRIQERSGSMSLPSIGFQSKNGKGFWMCFSQGNRLGDYGVDIEENKLRNQATISLTAPVVRERQRHWLSRMDLIPSTDTTASFKKDDVVEINFIVDFFTAPTVQHLYNEWVDLRTAYYPVNKKKKLIPFSEAFKIQEAKFNRENWKEDGYYAGGTTDDFFQDWQVGWTGGMMTTLPLLMEGGKQSRERVLKNFDWLYAKAVSPSGYYYDIGYKGKFFGAFPNKALGDSLHLVRKTADATYYIFKQFDAMKRKGIPIKQEWIDGNLKVLQAQIGTWKNYGQLGQFVNQETGRLVIGNTTSAGIFPASLCAAYRFTGNKEYLDVATQIANFYYDNFITKGLTCGGPGDAVQSFDSESSYGLLESLTELYETTREKQWLQKAEEMAAQFSTWIVGYDFNFPTNSLYDKLDIKSTGGVYANTQNKTAPPGICTHSGIALLKLYRASGNSFYINLLRDIAGALPQVMSWKDHQLPGFHDGWISERLNMNDWLEGIGETFAYSSWAETSLLLTITELPGVYVDLATAKAYDIDQVEVSVSKVERNSMRIAIHNPTQYEASVKLLAENAAEKVKPLLYNAALDWRKVFVPAGQTVYVDLKR